jgi:hypothetical protein
MRKGGAKRDGRHEYRAIGRPERRTLGKTSQGTLASGKYAPPEFAPTLKAILPCDDVLGIGESGLEIPRQGVTGKVSLNCDGVQLLQAMQQVSCFLFEVLEILLGG